MVVRMSRESRSNYIFIFRRSSRRKESNMKFKIHARKASNPEPGDFDYIEECACRIAERAGKKAVGYSGYFENANDMNGVIEKLIEQGFRPTQRPHCKLPALMVYWDNLLKGSGYPAIWLSKRVKGRRTVVRAVAGAHFINNEQLALCIRLFGDIETREYEENHS